MPLPPAGLPSAQMHNRLSGGVYPLLFSVSSVELQAVNLRFYELPAQPLEVCSFHGTIVTARLCHSKNCLQGASPVRQARTAILTACTNFPLNQSQQSCAICVMLWWKNCWATKGVYPMKHPKLRLLAVLAAAVLTAEALFVPAMAADSLEQNIKNTQGFFAEKPLRPHLAVPAGQEAGGQCPHPV